MYTHKTRTDTVSSALSRTSRRSDESYTSTTSTAATSVCDDHQHQPSFAPLTRQQRLRHTSTRIFHDSRRDSARSSCSSSRRSSGADFYAEPEEYGEDDEDEDYTSPDYTTNDDDIPAQPASTTPVPTTPHDFASFFPSHRRLTIAHDTSAEDMAMNLVISTTPEGGLKTPMQLFHLRMHDVPTRAFSLRRYCRESGREVCHSVLRQGGEKVKQQKKPTKHPKLQRSMSTALATVTRGGVKRADSWGASSNYNKSSFPPQYPTPLLTIPTRHDSGYATNSDDDDDFSSSSSDSENDEEEMPIPSSLPGKNGKKGKTNTTHLEFSNYAHVDLTRRGSAGKGKRWDFEYWGTPYSWKREGESYHLVPTSNSSGNNAGAVAHIVPDVLTPSQIREEEKEGGWIPKCSFWISDPKILRGGDVADVVVATGVLALVDDKARAASRRPAARYRRSIKVPMSPVKLDLEVVTPREMMRSVFRRGSRDERPGTAGGRVGRREESKLRFGRAVEAC
ncbi:hypothetical protein VE01_01558 [Pseudogymnoascus verrucosus]|uniref:Uncharacterized protein n=1 Tax=Pseudogymnoascus verrucosus TaxID=342668 RepID=A0A1B8GXF0_9PEZI|nr:uncharacterized protein VE01_01558 [Pseudogymnoascus verrucosus]OBU00506.1 hypothetical protein VE01_01558 [Pseudogymnoascus verrucosus]